VPTAGANGEALREGALMFAAFVALGLVPLVGYVALPAMCGAAFPENCGAAQFNPDARFAAACVVTSAALFGLGAAKARFVGRKWYALGAESLALGAACAAVAYGTSSWLNSFLPKGLAG
jgi:DNA damage-binding protein 1